MIEIISKLEDIKYPILLAPCLFTGNSAWSPNFVPDDSELFFKRSEYSSVRLPAAGEISAKICGTQLKCVLYFMSFGSSWN